MDPNWNDNQPIYRQLRDRMVALILEGALKEGDPLPSVRAVAADYRLNPLTVLKGYQQLVDERLVEKRRGRGMYVSEGARQLLLAGERERFLNEEWPHILAVIHRLGFSSEELFAQTPALTHPAPPPRGSLPKKNEFHHASSHRSPELTKKYGKHTALDRGELHDRGRPDRRAHRAQRRGQDQRAARHSRSDPMKEAQVCWAASPSTTAPRS
jgi:GntR family transcriptional regulator